MNSFLQWLSMGGYSSYVWSAYGIVCSVLLLQVLGLSIQKKRTHTKLRQWFKKSN
jgi:heme exporter protein D